MAEDELVTRRWFRERLQALKAQHPELTTSESQERLERELARQHEEDSNDGVQTDR